MPNRPGVVAELALALGRAGVNIDDMALLPRRRQRAGRGRALDRGERAGASGGGAARGAGPRWRGVTCASSPPRRCAARSSPPPDKSISHRAALLAAMAPSRCACATTSTRPTRTRRSPPSRRSARSSSSAARRAGDPRRRACAARAGRRRDRRRQRRHADAPAARAGSPGSRAAVDARRRRVDPPPPRRPDRASRCAGWARGSMRPRTASRRSRSRRAAARDRVRAAGRERAGQVAACCWPGCSPTARRRAVEPAPSRDHTERLLAAAGAPRRARRRARDGAPSDELELDALDVPGDPRRPRSSSPPPCSCPARGSCVEDMRRNWTRTGFLRIARADGRVVVGDARGAAARHRRRGADRASSTSPHAPLRGTVVEADEVPLAIDELPLVALLGCFAEGETVVRGAQELRRQGVRPDRDGRRRAARPRRRHRGDRRRLRRCAAPAACAAARSTPTATTAWRCSARSPAWPRARASRSMGMEAAAVSYPGFDGRPRAPARQRPDPLRPWSSPSTGPPGPASRRSPARSRRALGFTYLDSGAMYRSVGASRRPTRGAAVARRGSRHRARRARAARRRATSPRRSATPEVVRGRLARRRRPGGPRGARGAAAALMADGDWVAEGRDIGTVVAPGRRGQGLPHRDREERARRRAAELGGDAQVVLRGADPARRARPHPRALAARRRAATRCRSTPPASARRGRRPDRRARGRGEGARRREEGRRRRLSERRQVLARQPPHAVARGGRARALGDHPRPQGARDRLEWPRVRR